MWVRIPLRCIVLDTTLCDKVCQWLATGLWFSAGTLISSTNKTYHRDRTEILLIWFDFWFLLLNATFSNISEILLKVALSTINLHWDFIKSSFYSGFWFIQSLVYLGFGLFRVWFIQGLVYLGFGLFRILVYSGFGLDKFYCIGSSI